jgi:hypothetical protein
MDAATNEAMETVATYAGVRNTRELMAVQLYIAECSAVQIPKDASKQDVQQFLSEAMVRAFACADNMMKYSRENPPK